MKLKTRVEVEPLGEGRWAKIARALFERVAAEPPGSTTAEPDETRRSRAGRAWSGALAAAAVTVIAITGWALTHGAAPSFDGDRPSHIVTGRTGSMLVVGANSLAVSPDSEVVVSGSDDRGVLAVVERGRVTFSVAPRRGRPPFVVQAGEVGIRVIGTRFTVTRAGEGAGVQVDHGIVEVTAAGATTLVRDGESWPSGWSSRDSAATSPAGADTALTSTTAPNAAPPTGTTLEPTRRALVDGDRPGGPARESPSVTGGEASVVAGRPVTAKTRAIATDDLPDVPATGALPAFVGLRGASTSTCTISPTGADEHGATPAAQASGSVTALPSPSPAPTGPAAATTPTGSHAPNGEAPTAQDRFEHAERLERTEAVRALALYRELATESGPWAMNALFAAARLQLVRGSHDEARTLLTEYLRRYPQGPNAGDARRLLDRGH